VPTVKERKVVSVLFADLVGFTGLSEKIDPEDVSATLTPYFAALKKEIERFGGTVEKFIGDAVMAVFGAPISHEDDPERAVRAALRIPEAVADLNRGTEGSLSVRVAVNTGEVLVTLGARSQRGEGIVAGDVVNTASRLQSAAPVDGVVVGEKTFRATQNLFDYEPLPPVSLKGKSDRVPLWHAKSVRSRLGTDVQRFDSPFVGREYELDLLKATFARTLRESGVQLVTLVGEPGAGKSRILAEFSKWVDDRPEIVSWRQGRCLPYGEGITFWSLGEIVKAQTGVLESDPPEQAAEKLDASLDSFVREDERQWFRSKLGALIGLESSADAGNRQELFTAWRRFLEAVAAERPLIVIFEDLHWADDPLIEFIENLVEWATGVPILVLCTARPEIYERHASWGGGKRNSSTISLAPLTDAETAEMVAGLLAQAVLPAETQTALLERAGGNPLYAEEFVRMLSDRGFVEKVGSVVRIHHPEDIPVPESVHSLIAARLDTLEPELKGLVYDAAVVGKVFWSGALGAMGNRSPDEVKRGLHQLTQKEFVQPARTSSVENESEFSFWHVLIRDIAYAQTPRPYRCEKHQAAARWIEKVSGERVRDQAELLVHHYEQALELAQASGQGSVVEDISKGVADYALLAGNRAMDLDMGVALGYLKRAVELLPKEDLRLGGALLLLSFASTGAGSHVDAVDYAEQAIAAFEAIGDDYAASGVYALPLKHALHLLGRGEESVKASDTALALVEDQGPSPELALAYMSVAGNHMMASRPEPTIDLSNRGLEILDRLKEGGPERLEELARSRISPPFWYVRANNLQRTEGSLYTYRGIARCELGDLGGYEDLKKSVAIFEGIAAEGLAFSRTNLADFAFWIEGPEKGLAMSTLAHEEARSRGLSHIGTWILAESTWMLFDLGDWDELLRRAELVRERGENPHTAGMVGAYKAQVLLAQGRSTEAASTLDEVMPKARAAADPQVLVPATAVCALQRATEGDFPRARALIKELNEASASRFFKVKFLPQVVRTMIAIGDRIGFDELFDGCHESVPRDKYSLTTARALLAEHRGDLAEAEDLFREAVEGWKDFGHRFEHANALLGRARSLVALGRVAEARPVAEEARGLFEALGARPSLNEVESLLRSSGATAS
jgi:class 3 adenylate cyclase/tetratricopeptide (TPR) repeat protein